jgi:hypothetical protein
MRLPFRHPGRGTSRGSLGQSLAEFALVLPVLLLMLLIALDFGRIFLGWVGLNNAARIAANYAAVNPNAWGAAPNATLQAEYQRLVDAETTKLSCTLPTTVPDPTFPSGKTIGFPAEARITCQFTVITPIIGQIVGAGLPVTASAAFPIRSGSIGGVPADPVVPIPSPTPTPTPSPVPSPSPTPTPDPNASPTPTPDPNVTPTPTPTPTPSPTPSPSPTPNPNCTVPNLKNENTAAVQALWNAAGFTTNVVFDPLVSATSHYEVKSQSINQNQSRPCATTILTVSNRNNI